MRERLCEYNNCQIHGDVTRGGVTINFRGEERPFFCGAVHAALWLLKREGHIELAQLCEDRLK